MSIALFVVSHEAVHGVHQWRLFRLSDWGEASLVSVTSNHRFLGNQYLKLFILFCDALSNDDCYFYSVTPGLKRLAAGVAYTTLYQVSSIFLTDSYLTSESFQVTMVTSIIMRLYIHVPSVPMTYRLELHRVIYDCRNGPS